MQIREVLPVPGGPYKSKCGRRPSATSFRTESVSINPGHTSNDQKRGLMQEYDQVLL